MRSAAVIANVVVFLMSGCGGGANNPSDTPTAMKTPVNIAAVKAPYYGTAPVGTEVSFSLAGSDLQNNRWVGSYSLISDGVTSFEGQSVTSSHSVLTLQMDGAAPLSQTTTRYLWDNSMWKVADSSGEVCSLMAWPVLTDVSLVGEGFTAAALYNDGKTALIGIQHDPDVNGSSKLTFSTVKKTADNAIVSQEYDSFFFDALGNVYKMTVIVTTGGTTVTLSGKKN